MRLASIDANANCLKLQDQHRDFDSNANAADPTAAVVRVRYVPSSHPPFPPFDSSKMLLLAIWPIRQLATSSNHPTIEQALNDTTVSPLLTYPPKDSTTNPLAE